jgi:hypothetical protein
MARRLLRTLENIATPCSVNAQHHFLPANKIDFPLNKAGLEQLPFHTKTVPLSRLKNY